MSHLGDTLPCEVSPHSQWPLFALVHGVGSDVLWQFPKQNINVKNNNIVFIVNSCHIWSRLIIQNEMSRIHCPLIIKLKQTNMKLLQIKW